MKDLLLELLPHAPQMGLYVAPHVPSEKVKNALRDYAPSMHREEVLALYDATLLGNAKDGAVFAADRFVFQNTDLEAAQEVRYEDIVRVNNKRKLLGGRKVELDVNRARATVTISMDFSGKPEAAEFVARFLHEAMIRGTPTERKERHSEPAPEEHSETDRQAVRQTLEGLRRDGLLSEPDLARLLQALDRD